MSKLNKYVEIQSKQITLTKPILMHTRNIEKSHNSPNKRNKLVHIIYEAPYNLKLQKRLQKKSVREIMSAEEKTTHVFKLFFHSIISRLYSAQ